MKKFTYLLLLLCSFLLTSCFEIVEEIDVKKNGSGTAKTVIDMSQMMSMMGMFMPDSVKESMNMATMFEKEIARYESIKGLSNINVQEEKEYAYSISFDFKDMASLNKAMESTSDEESTSSMLKTDYGMKGKRTLLRKSSLNSSSEMMEGLDMSEEEMEQVFSFMSKPTYKVIYKFPKKVKKAKINDKGATVNQSGNTISIQYDLMEFMSSNGTIMDHKIKFQ